jgi:hypothetical protein
MLSGYRVYKTRADTLAYIVCLEEAIERRVTTYRAIKAARSATSAERREFMLIGGLSDFVARAHSDLRELAG